MFVADNYWNNGKPPSMINIANSGGRLYMGYIPIESAKPDGDHAIVFVYQPSKNEDCRQIYQKRFHIGLNNLVEAAISAGSGAAGGAILGSIIPGPGTVLGVAVGATVSFIGDAGTKYFQDNYTGDFLRFVS